MSDETALRIRLKHPLWEHGGHFESPQLSKQRTYEDLIAAADLLDEYEIERDALRKALKQCDLDLRTAAEILRGVNLPGSASLMEIAAANAKKAATPAPSDADGARSHD